MKMAKGRKITLQIKGIDLKEGSTVQGHIIRVTDNAGQYIVGCRMLEEREDIKDYVEKNYQE